jgi:hypothetical protein
VIETERLDMRTLFRWDGAEQWRGDAAALRAGVTDAAGQTRRELHEPLRLRF